jgi:hypothetical protein
MQLPPPAIAVGTSLDGGGCRFAFHSTQLRLPNRHYGTRLQGSPREVSTVLRLPQQPPKATGPFLGADHPDPLSRFRLKKSHTGAVTTPLCNGSFIFSSGTDTVLPGRC